MKVIVFMFAIVPLICAENILKLDLDPEEADKILANLPATLGYAKKLDEGPITPDVTQYQGRAIVEPNDYIQQTYLANQYHGQNGLGTAKFGYTDWNQGRVEHISPVKTEGAYQYVDPNGENIQVQYVADSQGFHQTDNRKIELPEPVTNTPEVAAAIAAHEKAWKEAAAANKAYGANYNGYGSASNNDPQYARQQEEEVTGPPRGFFYNVDYPVKLVIEKNEARRLNL